MKRQDVYADNRENISSYVKVETKAKWLSGVRQHSVPCVKKCTAVRII